MTIDNIRNYVRGWIVGSFVPAIHTADLEVGIHSYTKGTVHQAHYHKESFEINIVTNGTCSFTKIFPTGNTTSVFMKKGDILKVEPYEVFEFLAVTDCDLTVIKTKSVKDDKYIYEY